MCALCFIPSCTEEGTRDTAGKGPSVVYPPLCSRPSIPCSNMLRGAAGVMLEQRPCQQGEFIGPTQEGPACSPLPSPLLDPSSLGHSQLWGSCPFVFQTLSPPHQEAARPSCTYHGVGPSLGCPRRSRMKRDGGIGGQPPTRHRGPFSKVSTG